MDLPEVYQVKPFQCNNIYKNGLIPLLLYERSIENSESLQFDNPGLCEVTEDARIEMQRTT